MFKRTAKDIFRLGWPVLVAQIATMANGVIDTVMAGHFSAHALATVGLGTSIYLSIFVTAMGVMLALTPILSQHYGARDDAAITHDVRQGIWLALLLTLLAELLLLFPDMLFSIAKMDPAIEVDVRSYLRTLMWVAPAMMAFRVFYAWASSISQPRAVMAIQVLGLVIKAPLNVVFMYGKLGLPAMGGLGCAWALVCEGWLMLAAAIWWVCVKPGFGRYKVFEKFEGIDWRTLKRMFKLGLPIGVSFLIDVTSYTFMALFIARLGPSFSAGHQIAANLGALCYMVPLAISTATSVLVGQAIGAGQLQRARVSGWTGIAIGAGAALCVATIIGIAHGGIAMLYTQDPVVIAAAAPLLVFVGLFHFFDAINSVAAQAARGYKKVLVPMLGFGLALWIVGLGGGYWLAFSPVIGAPKGALGFWMGAVVGMALAAAIGVLYFRHVANSAIRGMGSTGGAGGTAPLTA
ncbi:MAG: efflux family protein [Betaproteobacteria bacterium]|nr:efflux family protein [Betaproteobacteria bacterium]